MTQTIPYRFFNCFTQWMSRKKLHYCNFGLKVYINKDVKNIHIYWEMHRYIPLIAKWNGVGNIGEKVVEHRPRKYGYTKFGIERFINGFLDLISVSFVNRYKKTPCISSVLWDLFLFFQVFWLLFGWFLKKYMGWKGGCRLGKLPTSPCSFLL